jgi:very-short-patch-repair endonuclease
MSVSYNWNIIVFPLPSGERIKVRGKAVKRNNVDKSRYLRKTQTDAERKLWSVLRNRVLGGIKFRRQFAVEEYIIDFYSPEQKLGVEADGGQHYDDEKVNSDKIRTEHFAKKGIKILRFSNVEILKNIDAVKDVIFNAIQNCPSSPPSPQRVEGKQKK